MDLRIVFIVIFFVQPVHAANFLLLHWSVTSHCLEQVGIGKELLKRGHTVVAYEPDTFKTTCYDNTNVTVVRFKMSQEGAKYQQDVNSNILGLVSGDATQWTFVSKMNRMCHAFCISALSSAEGMAKLRSLKIDMAIMPGLPMGDCLFYIPAILKARIVIASSHIFGVDSGAPWMMNVDPFVLSSYSARMSFKQRFLNALTTIAFESIMNVISLADTSNTTEIRHVVPEEILNQDIREIKKALLYLENSDSVIEYPRPTYPNLVRVGGLTTSPAKPLPTDLETFVSNAKGGVIVVSFGSVFRKSKFLSQKVIKLFQSLDRYVVMAYEKDGVHGKVKTVSWLPQNDVLGHPNTVLFISHCGKNGFYEGFYHGVPIICTPLNADGFSTAAKVKYHGVGTSMDIINTDAQELIRVIQDTLNDKKISRKMKRLSEIYHSAPLTPQQRAVDAIEHVMTYGGDHLRPETANMSFIGQTMIDIWFSLFLMILVILWAIFKMTRYCCRCLCCKRKNRTMAPKAKSD